MSHILHTSTVHKTASLVDNYDIASHKIHTTFVHYREKSLQQERFFVSFHMSESEKVFSEAQGATSLDIN